MCLSSFRGEQSNLCCRLPLYRIPPLNIFVLVSRRPHKERHDGYIERYLGKERASNQQHIDVLLRHRLQCLLFFLATSALCLTEHVIICTGTKTSRLKLETENFCRSSFAFVTCCLNRSDISRLSFEVWLFLFLSFYALSLFGTAPMHPMSWKFSQNAISLAASLCVRCHGL